MPRTCGDDLFDLGACDVVFPILVDLGASLMRFDGRSTMQEKLNWRPVARGEDELN